MLRKRFLVMVGVVLLSGSLGTDVRAGTITAAVHNGGGTFFTFSLATGYFFTPNIDIIVDQLGYFDENQDGLATSHDVGLFQASGAVLQAFATITPDSALVGQSRYESVVPVTLFQGEQYYIVANNNIADRYVYGVGAVSYAPEITFNGFGDSDTNSVFGSVINFGGVPGNFGPNFRFNVVPEPSTVVPEPSSFVIFSMGAIGVLGPLAVARRRRLGGTGGQ